METIETQEAAAFEKIEIGRKHKCMEYWRTKNPLENILF